MSGIYPDTFYRVSLKAIIRNEKGEVLLARERGGEWSLPGGGIDHGEDFKTALARELYEEIALSAPFSYTILDAQTLFIEERDIWLMWIICEVTPEDGYSYETGTDADDVAFHDPGGLRNNPDVFLLDGIHELLKKEPR